MTTIVIVAGGLAAMLIISVLIGTTLDTASQRQIRRRVADERRLLAIELRERREKHERLDGDRGRSSELVRNSPERCPHCGRTPGQLPRSDEWV